MVFPLNNLPTASRFWGREVEKKIVNLENSLRSSDINNTTRDAQLSVTAGQALIAAEEAQAAAALAQSAADAAQGAADDAAAAAADALDAFNAATAAGTLADSAQDDAIAALSAATDASTAASTANSNALAALQDIVDLSSTNGPEINAANITAGTLTAINGMDIPFGYVFADDVYASSTMRTDGTLQRTQLSDGTTTTATFTSGGFLVRTSSSERYKQDIGDLTIPYEDLINMQPKKFKRIDEVEELGELAREYPGFIAEDLAGTPLDIFTFYKTTDGVRQVEGIHYAELTAGLVCALKHQDQLIKDLTARIEALETN